MLLATASHAGGSSETTRAVERLFAEEVSPTEPATPARQGGPIPLDELGGLKQGAKLSSAGLKCDGTYCSRAAEVAGERGVLNATVCNSIVTDVNFSVHVLQASVLNLEAVPQIPGARVAPDVVSAGAAVYQVLHTALLSAGWKVQGPPEERYYGTSRGMEQVFGHADGRQRKLMVAINPVTREMLALDPGAGASTTVALMTFPPVTCTAGL